MKTKLLFLVLMAALMLVAWLTFSEFWASKKARALAGVLLLLGGAAVQPERRQEKGFRGGGKLPCIGERFSNRFDENHAFHGFEIGLG